MSLAAEGFAVMVDLAPPVRMGAVQMLISVPSEAVKWVTSTNGSPAVSVTDVVEAPLPFQTPTSTTRRSPAVTLAPVVTARLVLADPWASASCTKAGVADAAPAVTE